VVDAVALVVLPAAAAVVAGTLPARIARHVALAAMVVVAVAAGLAVSELAGALGSAAAPADRWFAVDASNAVFLLLTAAVFPLVLAGSWDAPEAADRLYVAQWLLLESALLGTFLAQDLLVLFVLWEAALLPMLLMIVTRGGPDRVRAALTFLLYTMAGSVPFLGAVLVLGAEARSATGTWDFDLATLEVLPLTGGTQTFVFLAIAFACAIKSPVFPFHGWLPLAYGQAPASATALMAGVLSKMGAFGLLRLAIPLAPVAAARYAPVFVAMGAASLLYGALLALRPQPPRALVAYASLSHMGYVVIGAFTLTAAGAHGALLQVLSHGVAVTGLFLVVGLIERRTGDDAARVAGLATHAPRLAVVLSLFVLASIAVPATSGFAAEFLVLLGAFERGMTEWQAGGTVTLAAAVLAVTTVVLGAAYMLRFVRRHVFGTAPSQGRPVADLGRRELTVCCLLLAAVFALGLWPAPAMQLVQPAVDRIVAASTPASSPAARVSASRPLTAEPVRAD
jgi:NADH-quinone oxidoreductase subunit M